MKEIPYGLWVGRRSTIQGYIPGNEWLQFLPRNKDHVWKLRQPVGELWICRFRLVEEKDGFRFFPTTHASEQIQKEGWPITLDLISPTQLAVTHHGYTTTFIKQKE